MDEIRPNTYSTLYEYNVYSAVLYFMQTGMKQLRPHLVKSAFACFAQIRDSSVLFLGIILQYYLVYLGVLIVSTNHFLHKLHSVFLSRFIRYT